MFWLLVLVVPTTADPFVGQVPHVEQRKRIVRSNEAPEV
jgi:hypothetical protein